LNATYQFWRSLSSGKPGGGIYASKEEGHEKGQKI
jgi:hypothetical protein